MTNRAILHTNHGDIEVALFEEDAPKTVANFIDLAGQGFYDGTIFHRVIRDFMIQGGDPTGTGTGSNGNVRLKAEFNRHPGRRHTRGVLSMARSNDPNSASCQFFIMHDDAPHLDGQYSAFGKVTAGMEAVDKSANSPKGANDRPKNPPKILKITVHE